VGGKGGVGEKVQIVGGTHPWGWFWGLGTLWGWARLLFFVSAFCVGNPFVCQWVGGAAWEPNAASASCAATAALHRTS